MAADIILYLSGGTTNTDPDAALGGARSTDSGAIIPQSATTNSVFDDVSGAEESAGDIEYRCAYAYNSGDVAATSVTLFISSNTTDPDTQVAIGLGTSIVSGTEQTIADEDTAPSGVAFSEPSTEGTGLGVGTLEAGEHKAFWWRRTIDTGAGASADQITFDVTFDTAP